MTNTFDLYLKSGEVVKFSLDIDWDLKINDATTSGTETMKRYYLQGYLTVLFRLDLIANLSRFDFNRIYEKIARALFTK